MKREIESSVTVYLCLILGVMLSFTFTILEAGRQQVIKAEIEGVADIALFSVLGEYHRLLLERYDIFAIDANFGKDGSTTGQLESHIQYYFNENFTKKNRGLPLYSADLTKLFCDGVSVGEYLLLSDNQGDVLKEAIINYMQHHKGNLIVDSGRENYETIENQEKSGNDNRRQWQEMGNEIKRLLEERNLQRKEGEDPVVIDNPADYVEATIQEGPLSLALPPGKEISTEKINLSDYFSHRGHNVGAGNLSYKKSGLNSLTERLYLEEYLFDKCSFYNEEKEDSLLKYQMEYLLHGEKEDKENLEKTVKRILMIREGINLTFLTGSSAKQAEAETMASLISIACLMPEIKEPLKIVILCAWAYAESIQDLRILLDGKKVPTGKTEESWNTPLSQLLSFTSHLGEYHSVEEGMNYRDYLKFFLWSQNKQEVLLRFIDICEMDIRTITGNSKFYIDRCISVFKATSYINSDYGGSYEITRTGYYE